jgi:hypothetical protein
MISRFEGRLMPRFTTPIQAYGTSGNVFAIMGTACRLMRELGVAQPEILAFTNNVMRARSYPEAIDVVREWFPVDLEG